MPKYAYASNLFNYECLDCSAVIKDKYKHTKWHEENDKPKIIHYYDDYDYDHYDHYDYDRYY